MGGGKRDSRDELLEQQTALACFGELALKSDDLDEILSEACRLVGRALHTGLAKVLELQEGGKTLLVRAGFGWSPDVVGKARLPVGPSSSAGHAMSSGEPVISPDIEKDERFDYPAFLRENGVRAVVNTIIIGPDGQPPYGVLEVDSREVRQFTADDIHFLRTYANLVASAVARLRMMEELRARADEKERLLRELQHRVKNNLQAITSLVDLQRNRTRSAEVARELEAVGQRIGALRLLHEKLHAAGNVDQLCLGTYLGELSASLLRFRGPEAGQVRLVTDLETVAVSPELAIPVGLIVNEFIVNSLKYAFEGGRGTVGIRLEAPGDDAMRLELWDDGKGLPEERHGGTGMRLIGGFARQIGAEAAWQSAGGTHLSLTIPRPSK